MKKRKSVYAKNKRIIDRFNRRYNRRVRTLAGVVYALEAIGMKRREIAEYMDKSPKAVDSIKARDKYKKSLSAAAAVRRPECRHYNQCLDVAARENLESMGCGQCRRFVPDAELMADSLLIVADGDAEAALPGGVEIGLEVV